MLTVRPRKQYPRMSISNRVRTEPLTEAHADELYQGFLDSRIYSFIPEQPPKSLEAMRREYREFAEGAPSGSNEVWLNWAVRELSTSQCIGTLQVTVYSDGLLWVGYKLTHPPGATGMQLRLSPGFLQSWPVASVARSPLQPLTRGTSLQSES